MSAGEGADPAAVIFDTVKSATARGYDMVIADTAGRLHNKANLMAELSKISRSVKKASPEASLETLLVLDAITGQNAISQAKEFCKAADATGIILTKLDGTAKGGVAVAVSMQYGIPITYVGLGEKMEDLRPSTGMTSPRRSLSSNGTIKKGGTFLQKGSSFEDGVILSGLEFLGNGGRFFEEGFSFPTFARVEPAAPFPNVLCLLNRSQSF